MGTDLEKIKHPKTDIPAGSQNYFLVFRLDFSPSLPPTALCRDGRIGGLPAQCRGRHHAGGRGGRHQENSAHSDKYLLFIGETEICNCNTFWTEIVPGPRRELVLWLK